MTIYYHQDNTAIEPIHPTAYRLALEQLLADHVRYSDWLGSTSTERVICAAFDGGISTPELHEIWLNKKEPSTSRIDAANELAARFEKDSREWLLDRAAQLQFEN